MPIFEYHCRDCGQAFETFVTGDRKPACPECHGANLAKLLSRPGMVGAGDRQPAASEPSFGGCGAGGASCACRANAH
ncbi:MAG TPA: zinc ribbon domain-containing protein [Vicinamibacterales bacterium]|nr:zinc ribbon domain-containing protein [Vicinamibacterales bacterium]